MTRTAVDISVKDCMEYLTHDADLNEIRQDSLIKRRTGISLSNLLLLILPSVYLTKRTMEELIKQHGVVLISIHY